ncbi:MAG: SDR family NAD(P)-dependent oxidoreductase [Actinomycetota bacterium]
MGTDPAETPPLAVLVAGGASGIGLASGRAFRARGDDVVFGDIAAEAANRAAAEPQPGRAWAFPCDLEQPPSVSALVGQAVEAMGRLDVVFVSAGILVSAPLERWTVEQWDRSLAVNLRAPFLLVQSALPHLLRSANASVIVTASTGAFRGHAGMPAYHASKSGLIGLVRSLADELSPRGIRVNAICPGWIDTPFNEPYWSFQRDRQAALESLESSIPAGRQGTPEDVADVVTFLASPAARYVTGSSVVVDGGYSAV